MRVKRKLFVLKAKNFPKLKAGHQVLEWGTHKCSVQQMNRQAHTRCNMTFKNPRDKERNLKKKSQMPSNRRKNNLDFYTQTNHESCMRIE